tara:strand:+ start:148 stop:630 length:483 start_codon:yes stop_codon:yes gene_type:complete
MSRYLVFTLLLLCNITTQAEPKVVFDSGRTISSDKYLSELQSEPAPKQKPNIAKLATPNTPEMSVGRVTKRTVSLPYLPSPLFLVGADNISIQWLNKHRQALIKAGAVGLIVNSASASDLQAVIRAADGLQVSPASGSDLANQFNLKHYPLLITRTQIAQ